MPAPDPAPLPIAELPRLGRGGVLELRARRALQGLYAGRHRSHSYGSSVEFADHRPYQPGDDLRAVDWKAFARSDHLLIRRFRDDRNLPVVLVVDCSASMGYGRPGKLERANELAAILGLLALDQQDQVQLYGARRRLLRRSPRGASVRNPTELCEQLAANRARQAGDLAGALRALNQVLRKRSFVILLSDLLEELDPVATELAVCAQRGHDLAVLQILDRTEISLPLAWGRAEFVDPEGRLPALPGDSALLAARYQQGMAAHLQRCRAVVTGARGDHLLLPTDADPLARLGPWLLRRQRGGGGGW